MAQKHNAENINAPMTRNGGMVAPEANKRIVRGLAYTATQFTTENPILQDGEIGYEKDTHLLKVGDGTTKWNELPYAGDGNSVISVNGKTGTVVLDATDVGALANATTAADIGGVEQVSTMPTPSADNMGDIIQFVGTTGTYTNGYFYKCVSDGQDEPTYSWTQVSVQPLQTAVSILSAITGYDSTKNQTLKNVAGALTWVDDE